MISKAPAKPKPKPKAKPAPLPALPQEKSWQSRWFHFVLWVVILSVLIMFLRAVEPILLPFVLGMFVAYLMDPLVSWLERQGLGRSLATAIITFGLFSCATMLIIWLVPILYQQLAALFAQAAPLLKSLNSLTGGNQPDAIPGDMGQIVDRTLDSAGKLAGAVFSSGAALLNVTALLLITPIVCFYLIRDWPRVVRKADGLLPRAYAPVIREQLYLINRTLASYVRGQLVVMLIMSVFYVTCFVILGLKFALLLGLLAGVIIIVPYVGSLISVSLGMLVAFSQFGTEDDFWIAAAIYAAGQILESQILTPKIIGERVGLHPLWMLFGMLAGAVLLGMAGVLLAVPLTAVIGVLVKFAVERYKQSGLYHE